MTSNKKTETVSTPTVPARSVARGELNRRIMALEAAKAKVDEKHAAARRLAMMGETAKALAAQLAGLKAQAAATLAEHALNGTGRPPKLSEDGREALAAKLAEAEATAEAAGPAIEIVQTEISRAHADLNRASGGVHAMVVPVLEEELQVLDREIRALNAKLLPLHSRLAGLRSWATMKGAGKDGQEREPFQRLMQSAMDAMQAGLVSPQTPTRGTESTVWGALAERLLTDPDALAVPHAEAA